jgi:hypothetical protein
MDHSFIDENSIAEHYLDNTLPHGVRRAFERHLVDCQECTDRILLAEMFHARSTNGASPHPAHSTEPPPGLVVKLKPLQLVWIVLVSLLLLLAIPVLVWLVVRRSAH